MSNAYGIYRHAGAGFTLPLPTEWEISEEVEGCALVASEPNSNPGGFVPNVVVTVQYLRPEESVEEWVQRSREELQESLNQLRIIDTEETEIGGRRAWRTLSHYMHPSGGVNLEQWSVAHGTLGYVVSCSMAALDYDDVADAMAYMAEGLRIEEVPS